MTVLVDMNIVLDVLLRREPHWLDSAAMLSAAEIGRCRALLSATTVTTIHYLIVRAQRDQDSLGQIRHLLAICGLAAVNEVVLASALELGFADFEDAVLHEAARQAGCEAIVTRNLNDFGQASMPVFLPGQFIQLLDQ